MAPCEDAVQDGLPHWGRDASSDQGLELFQKLHRAERLPECELALQTVRKKNGNAPSFIVVRRRLFVSFTGQVF